MGKELEKELEKEIDECETEDSSSDRVDHKNRYVPDTTVHYDVIKLEPLMSLIYYKVFI